MGSPSEIPPDALLGGKIRLIQRIGRGGMGDVWVARNESTQAEVAVKTLQRSERTTLHDERFRREARLAATVSHRNVVRIFDLVDESDGTLGLVMELLRGGTLEGCMRERGPLPSLEAVAVAVPILSALHHVHQKGIIHRDVKPANIFFAVEPDGHVIPKILDFGIAKLPAAGSALTVDGSVLGTPHYMSPEQIRGQDDIDGRSEMFALAVVLYEMLTGTRIFQRDSAAASLASVLEYDVDPDPRIEPRIWVVLSRALAKRPYERYASCAELADALRKALDVSDEDLVQALQELRPKTENIATPSTSGTAKAADTEVSLPGDATLFGKPKRSFGPTIAVASVAAIAAVIATLALTRSKDPKDARASAPEATASVTIASAPATNANVNGNRDVIPPPEPTPPESASPIMSSTSARPSATAHPTGGPIVGGSKAAPPKKPPCIACTL